MPGDSRAAVTSNPRRRRVGSSHAGSVADVSVMPIILSANADGSTIVVAEQIARWLEAPQPSASQAAEASRRLGKAASGSRTAKVPRAGSPSGSRSVRSLAAVADR
jgi:hypothetical protein